jgi:hypothetical protein
MMEKNKWISLKNKVEKNKKQGENRIRKAMTRGI